MSFSRFSFVLLVVVVFSFAAAAQEMPHNIEQSPQAAEVTIQSVISVTDTGWSTNTSTSDCATGWADDEWHITVTQFRNLTVTITDCCCPGDYFQFYFDGTHIGTTPQPSSWGCNTSGSRSTGSFTVALCPGTHIIKVRDAGFDGHSPSEISAQNMCPAGFTVTGTLSALMPVPVAAQSEQRIEPTADTDVRGAELAGLLAQVEPYVYIDRNGLERLRTADARQAGVSGEAIGLAMRLIALDNRVIAAAQRGEEADFTRADFEFVEPLFLHFAQQDPCGTRQNPAPCPPRIESGMFFGTREAAIAHLVSQGFHRTSNYAGGASGNDYSMVVSHSCGGSSFREQAIIYSRNNCWTYNLQGPEPNPEVLEYIWPRFGWPGYVRWWHMTFC